MGTGPTGRIVDPAEGKAPTTPVLRFIPSLARSCALSARGPRVVLAGEARAGRRVGEARALVRPRDSRRCLAEHGGRPAPPEADGARLGARAPGKGGLERPGAKATVACAGKEERGGREQREIKRPERQGPSASQALQPAGKGREPPHRASVAGLSAEVRFAAGVDKGMVGIG